MAFNDSMDQFANEKREYVMGETSEDIDPTDWKESEVVRWLRSLGLGNYGDNFVKHCITGELLHMLTEEHFKELGVGPITLCPFRYVNFVVKPLTGMCKSWCYLRIGGDSWGSRLLATNPVTCSASCSTTITHHAARRSHRYVPRDDGWDLYGSDGPLGAFGRQGRCRQWPHGVCRDVL